MKYDLRMTRATALVVILLGAAMVGLPSQPGEDAKLGAVGNAAAADVDRLFTIGGIEIAVSTLNPFTYTMVDEYMAIWPCMSTLLTYDENMNRIGDLATRWTMSPDGLTWTFYLVNNAYFTQPSSPNSLAYPLTSADVKYTYWLVQNYSHNLHYYFPGYTDGTPSTIQSISTPDPYTVSVTLAYPYAPFVGALTGIPIVPKYYWEPLIAKAGSPSKVTGVLPIGSGYMYYALPGLPTAGEIVLKRSPVWFQEQNRGWQIHVDTWKYKALSDTSTLWLALKQGTIDCMMGVPPTTYVNDLPGTPNVIGFAQSTGFVYEYNLNQMSTTMRSQLVSAGWTNFKTGSNNQLLLDPVIKKALAMSVDKPGFISSVLQGLGTVADSLVPDVNPWHYTYGSKPGETPISFNTAAARSLLWANGWKYNALGQVVSETSTQVPLYGYVGTTLTPLQFRFYTLNTDPEWAVGAQLLKTWAGQAGIQLDLALKSTNQMNSLWWAADYDVWLWDWMFTPMSDPSTDVMSVLTTMEIGSWSDVYYSNATYDAIYNRSLRAMDPTARRELTDQMQRMAYEDMSCQLVAYRKELYAVNTQRWVNYGDWSAQFMLMPDQGYPYLYMRISPNGDAEPNKNLAPVITSLATSFSGTVNNAISFTGAATDTQPLVYQWYWGDGTKSGWLTSPSTTHTYTMDGIYDVYFAAKEQTSPYDDYYITSKKTTVTVTDPSNRAPTGLSISMVPTNPDTGDLVTFTGVATDPDGDPLYFSWNFGDTYTAVGQVVQHQFVTPGTYNVVMSVTDNHIGDGLRPQTTSRPVLVTANLPPSIDVPDYQMAEWKKSTTFTVTASDPEGDTLRFTWFWGDGSISVTSTNTATHTYSQKGLQTLKVYVDDLTGLKNHNVSDSGQVMVYQPGGNKIPVITAWSASTQTPYTGQVVTFTASARDQDGDYLTFTLAFGDGTQAVRATATNPNQVVTFKVDKSYVSGGSFSAYLYVWDGLDTVTSAALVMTVSWNYPPSIEPLPTKNVVVGTSVSFYAAADDPEGDTMKYTWNFGDGSWAVGNPVTHTYAQSGAYVYWVYVDDLHGHNVSAAAYIYVKLSYTISISSAGWSLITVPFVDHGYKASTLGLSFGDEVVGWNPATKAYDRVYFIGISPAPMDFYLNANEAYWVYTSGPRTLNLLGFLPDETVIRPVTVPDGGGWVLFGIPDTKTGWMANNVTDMYSGVGSVTAVASYTGSGYQVYYPVLPFTNFPLTPGKGLWVYITESGYMIY